MGTLQLLDGQWRTGPGVALLALGAVTSFLGLVRYRRADTAIRRGALPPAGRGPALVAAAVGVVAVALVALSLRSELL